MDVAFSPMREPTALPAGGAHDSAGWQVDTPWHRHDMHQLLYAFDGFVDVEDEKGSHRVPHQFAAWIPAGTPHRTRLQKVRSGSVFLAAALVPAAGEGLQVIRAPALLREMMDHAMRWPIGSPEDEFRRAFFTCMAWLCPEWIADSVALDLPTCRDPRIEAVIERTRKALASITFDEVSRGCGYSERTLRRKFVQETGMTWDAYRRRLRVLAAIDLLESTTRPVGSIALDVGYENQAAFAKAFRAAVGINPTEYRRARD